MQATNMPHKCHMLKLPDVHLYSNKYATYEVAPKTSCEQNYHNYDDNAKTTMMITQAIE